MNKRDYISLGLTIITCTVWGIVCWWTGINWYDGPLQFMTTVGGGFLIGVFWSMVIPSYRHD